MPGGITHEGIFSSPLGASVGGPVLNASVRTESVVAIIRTLQEWIVEQDFRGAEITLPPPVIHRTPNQVLEFALHYCGFQLAYRSMPLMIPLQCVAGPNRYARLFSTRRRSYVRAKGSEGIQVREAGVDAFPQFLHVLDDTYSRHGTAPTHTPDEIRDLLERLPNRVTLWLAELGDIPLAGVLLFRLNPQVCTTFYICDHGDSRQYHGMSILFARLIDGLAEQGLRYLDLGPSAATDRFNTGVISFKESIGAEAFCRDRYCWMR